MYCIFISIHVDSIHIFQSHLYYHAVQCRLPIKLSLHSGLFDALDSVEQAKALLAKGANLEVKDTFGWPWGTPLQEASCR